MEFIGGVLASLSAAIIWYLFAIIWSYSKLSYLKGYWFQEIPNFGDRCYSIGKFSYNKIARTFCFDGTNYKTSGEDICIWKCISFHVDNYTNNIFYTFYASMKGKLFERLYGFGVMNLNRDDNNRLYPNEGHFIDVEEGAKPHSFEMRRIEEVIEELSLPKKYIKKVNHNELVSKYHQFKSNKIV